MSFDVAADAYDRFMGRYSSLLSPQLADLAGIRAGQRVLDVGCGPGALTAELVRRLDPGAVSAVDPSEPFVAAARTRHPGVDVQRAPAESLPFPDRRFDATLAQLVVHFMTDPVAGLAEMARVTRRRVVAACVWDHAGGQGPLSLFWDAARAFDPGVTDESDLAGARAGHLECCSRPRAFQIEGRPFRRRSGTRASMSGGAVHHGVGPPARTWPVSIRSARRSCANGAARYSRTRHSS
jgi:SAM-dependent methyltransferase